MHSIFRGALVATVVLAASAASAAAAPSATNDATYSALGRVFPDPLGGCQAAGAAGGPCSPFAQGNVPAAQFIQWGEFLSSLQYMNQRAEWKRYMEVWPLDGKLGDGAGSDERAAFPGNDLGTFEFTPKASYVSAGLATTTLDRSRSDLIVVRVTDESVPDAGKVRYALSLGMHGLERAGVEGGVRAIEDLVTARTIGTADKPILPASAEVKAPTFAEALEKSIVYFTFPNPDGWRRGSVSEGGTFFQRYNGNGVDTNRDWPAIGFTFRPYSGLSEPEVRGLSAFFKEVKANGGPFAAGDDLHGQPGADALSYTLLPHGRHDYAKDVRLREAAKAIGRGTDAMTRWSPLIQSGDEPVGGGLPCSPAPIVSYCAKIYAQTWGTVYDTINYTTTGALGDWFDDATVGLGADGIDNEMSFSHLDKAPFTFEPQTEQLHVDGNKALIYARIAGIVDPPTGTFDVGGAKGYVPNARLTRTRQVIQGDPAAGATPQPDIVNQTAVAGTDGTTVFPIDVKASTPESGITNGGMRVDVRTTNVAGVGTGLATLAVQCKGCQGLVGEADSDGWVTVQEDYNQSFVYLQAGLTAAVNRPQGGPGVSWRAVVSEPSAVTRMDVEFTAGPSSLDGSTAGDPPPVLEAYDVANTDFFADLNKYIPTDAEKLQTVDPAQVIAGTATLDGLDTLALADTVLPRASSYNSADVATWTRKVGDWVRAGGTLVLTDGALTALPAITGNPALRATKRLSYVGQVSFLDSAGKSTLGDPLAKNVDQPGARFNSGARRQTFEASPLGFAIQNPDDSDAYNSPIYDVAEAAWKAAGGTIAAESATTTAALAGRVTFGELKLGQGRVRIAGALLPQPSQKFDHTLGLEPYAVTYTGYILARNLLTPPAG